uniref:RRM domain-containing protein n=2 Tax=Palpitomonas bilix TaxID=652834 RepID=A0A7S3GBP8_9EUKA|mmetsp:Transcript_40467/g.104880  ORF Transcript_40467/g.104880 Transcript_40467/m.104880 type:complete len:237 (+) Transcript_40467:246-956(+)
MADLDAELALFEQELKGIEEKKKAAPVVVVESKEDIPKAKKQKVEVDPKRIAAAATVSAAPVLNRTVVHERASSEYGSELSAGGAEGGMSMLGDASLIAETTTTSNLPASGGIQKLPPSGKVYKRKAANEVWEDPKLAEWPDDDYRIFVGNLGNDVGDELLSRTFNEYPSFQRARVIRDKRLKKTRGFGFVSFADAKDFLRALREKNGAYCGNRPMQIKKSDSHKRNIAISKKVFL